MRAPGELLPDHVASVAVIGAGSVGASWAALFLAHGIEAIVHDPAPRAPERVRAFVDNAWPALRALGIAGTESPPAQKLRFVASAGQAAALSDLVQENVLEKSEVKAQVLAEIEAAASPDKIIFSSTGGIPPTALQASCRHPERLVVVHPFNPAHLMPLVEVVAGRRTALEVVEWAMAFARRLGKQPIRLHTEAPGHLTNRLQAAVWREAVWCLMEGVASASDIDTALRYGLAPRWLLMGSLMTLHLAGGPGGMAGILAHTGDAIEQWWTPLGEPRMNARTRARLVAAAGELARGRPVGEWVQWRDEHLIGVLRTQRQAQRSAPQEAAQERPGGENGAGAQGSPSRSRRG
ncbi:MAG: 3-hydroxyacyl-CoA dehydrogenase [Burkholderiales bacterium]|nr:3-hydroxyacyl-CoA dehydrogenase [Burkholderiales bacterium]